jgi:hypothetical protein
LENIDQIWLFSKERALYFPEKEDRILKIKYNSCFSQKKYSKNQTRLWKGNGFKNSQAGGSIGIVPPAG